MVIPRSYVSLPEGIYHIYNYIISQKAWKSAIYKLFIQL